jgi:pimeloyl-ACP methyl ester carboxylesterase
MAYVAETDEQAEREYIDHIRFDFALPWAETHRVMIPFQPGFGESGDDPSLDSMQDYVMHYAELFDALGLDRFALIGFSLGGYLASKFATVQGHRVDRLVLVSPAGLRDDAHPTVDLFVVPPEEVPAMLVSNMEVLLPHLPTEPDIDFMADRYRESTTLARLLWEKPWDPKLPRYLHRLTMPTLLVWGDEDRIIPVGQSETWHELIPDSQIKVFKNAGNLVLDEKPEAAAAVAAFLD